MASKMLVQLRGSSLRNIQGKINGKVSELLLKRNVSQYKEQLEAVEKHAAETFLTWRNISIFVAFPVCSYLFYKHMIVGEHLEAPKEFIAYEHMRLRKKPFPWGDGDKSLFHNEKFNVGPDTDFDGEEEPEHHEEEPIITRWFRYFMSTPEELTEWRDKHLRQMQIIAVENLDIMNLQQKPPVPKDAFIIYENSRKPIALSVDD